MAGQENQQYTVLYGRLSQEDERAGESNSIQHQKQMLEDYAMKHGFTNLVHFTDDGWSGATFDRPSWNRLVEGVKNGEITACICKDMSRIGRDHLQVGFFTDILFREKEVRFIAIKNQYGEIAPQQEKALEALGFELPEPEKPVGRKNNRKMTFDSACRVLLFDVAKKHGLQLEEEPEYGGRAYLEKQDYILFKQKEQLAAQEQKLEELTMKIEDVEALVDEVADIAYDKAVEVVADTVKLETHKEDIKLVEQSKAWVLSPERKASKKEVEYAVKRLDGVIARITNAMKSTIQKIQTTLMKPEVKKAGTEQIKKKAKSSIIEQLSRKKKEIAEREVSRTDQAKSKKQDMEL